MSDFRFQPWPGTIAITTLLEFCSWLQIHPRKECFNMISVTHKTFLRRAQKL